MENQSRIFPTKQTFKTMLETLMRPGTSITVSDGALEGLKWLALVSMTYDHVVRLMPSLGVIGEATAFGRIAFPLFAFIIAYNLSRPGSGPVVYRRVIGRLLLFGALATPAMVYFIGPHLLNILFTFALAIFIWWLFEERRRFLFALPLAVILFTFGGGWVEYGWVGLGLTLSFLLWLRTGSTVISITLLALSFTLLDRANGSYWALLAWPIIFAASLHPFHLPRSKWLFYIYYPAHLTLLMIINWYFFLRAE